MNLSVVVWDLKRLDAPVVIWELCQRTSRGCTCVRRVVINSCVLNFKCNKVPS
jgi:hypothetical protein